MNKHQKAVLDFHKAFDLTVGASPAVPGEKDIELRDNLIKEEALEFSQASDEKSLEGAADALADLLYVVYGAANTYGIDMEPVFEEVHRSNMTKLWSAEDIEKHWGAVSEKEGELQKIQKGDRFVVRRQADGKVIKSPSYSKADILGALARAKIA